MSCSRGFWCSDNPILRDPGCGQHFRTEEGFQAHFKVHPGRVLGRILVCCSTADLADSGWVIDGPFWLSPRDQQKRLKVRLWKNSRINLAIPS